MTEYAHKAWGHYTNATQKGNYSIASISAPIAFNR